MSSLPISIQNLITEFSKLPGIGPKTAARLTFYLLRKSDQDVGQLGQAFLNLKAGLVLCQVCTNIADQNPCSICNNPNRNPQQIMVLEEPLDVIAFERTGSFHGVYHVLHGVISPMDGIGPQNLKIQELIKRASSSVEPLEIILATNPSLEGEATATYIHHALQDMPHVTVTRIALGLPAGGDLEYADDITLGQALSGRRKY